MCLFCYPTNYSYMCIISPRRFYFISLYRIRAPIYLKDTDKILQHGDIPNTIIVAILSVVDSAFLKGFKRCGIINLIQELTQNGHLQYRYTCTYLVHTLILINYKHQFNPSCNTCSSVSYNQLR